MALSAKLIYQKPIGIYLLIYYNYTGIRGLAQIISIYEIVAVYVWVDIVKFLLCKRFYWPIAISAVFAVLLTADKGYPKKLHYDVP